MTIDTLNKIQSITRNLENLINEKERLWRVIETARSLTTNENQAFGIRMLVEEFGGGGKNELPINLAYLSCKSRMKVLEDIYIFIDRSVSELKHQLKDLCS